MIIYYQKVITYIYILHDVNIILTFICFVVFYYIGYTDEIPYDLMVPSKKGDAVWWEGYTGQRVVIIDDFYGNLDIDTFKRIIDRYPLKVNVKNGSAQFLAERVYITSNTGWRNWWPTDLLSNKNNEPAILRRITVEKNFINVYQPANPPVIIINDQPIRSEGDIVADILAYNTGRRGDDPDDLVCHERIFDDDDDLLRDATNAMQRQNANVDWGFSTDINNDWNN